MENGRRIVLRTNTEAPRHRCRAPLASRREVVSSRRRDLRCHRVVVAAAGGICALLAGAASPPSRLSKRHTVLGVGGAPRSLIGQP